MKLRNYTSEKIFDPRNTREKKILDPRNTYLKKFGTHERSMQKNFGPTKYPRRHDGTRPMKFSTLCKSIYIFWKFFQYTMHWDKKNPSEKMTVTKNAPFFLSRAPTHHRFTFNSQFLCEMKRKVHLSKAVCGIFHFRFRLVFMKVYIFVQLNSWTLPLLKRHNSFQK